MSNECVSSSSVVGSSSGSGGGSGVALGGGKDFKRGRMPQKVVGFIGRRTVMRTSSWNHGMALIYLARNSSNYDMKRKIKPPSIILSFLLPTFSDKARELRTKNDSCTRVGTRIILEVTANIDDRGRIMARLFRYKNKSCLFREHSNQ